VKKSLRLPPRAVLALALLAVAGPAAPQPPPSEATEAATPQEAAAVEPQAVVKKGVRVEFSVENAGAGSEGAAPVTEGEYAEVRFRVTDAGTGAPVSPLEPAVWITRTTGLEDLPCRERIGSYLQGLLGFQADVDLNKYFIMMLNDEPSISVVDPLLGVSGITQLYAMVMLEKRGEDWARSADDKLLFVTMPRAGKVAVVDLESFKVVRNVEAGSRPVRIALQPDGKYLWVGNDGEAEVESGVTVIDAQAHAVAATIATGAGHHEIAFSADSLFAFVTNRAAGTVSVIDVQKLEKVKDLRSGTSPLAVGFSALSQAAYVASADGTVVVVDGDTATVTARLATGAGLEAFRLDPTGRWGLVANAVENRVDVLDISSGALAHRLEVAGRPHQFAFTDTYAYVRHLDTAEVTLIPLAQLSLKARPGLQTVSFGSRAPGEYPYPASADAISPTGEWTAVVSANPADKMVYYYMEGMVAPMGSYTTYGRSPRAVGVVDRSVRETEKGVYAAKFRVPGAGDYNVAFLMDTPFIDHCFAFSAEPGLVAARLSGSVELEFVVAERRVAAGGPLAVRFVLTDGGSGEPLSGLEDVTVLATRPPGNWQERRAARSLGAGLYEASVTADEPGSYYVSVGIPSLGLDFTELPYVTFLAVEGGREEQQEEGR
jgi:DNA-binding beta-propeller fold protein YncE